MLLVGAAAFFLLILQFRHRRRYQNEDSDEALAEKAQAEQSVKDEERGDMCSFWFVSADFVRGYTGGATLPRFQELRDEAGALIRVPVPFMDAFLGKFNEKGEYCVVSHRWMEPGEPDADGTQFRVIREHLLSHPKIKYLWFDFWCVGVMQQAGDLHGEG